MVYRRISSDLKELAFSLWEIGWEVEEICELFDVSRASMYRWRSIFDEHGAVNRPPSPLRGRLRAVVNEIHNLDPDIYLDELVLWLATNRNIGISKSALQRNLEDAGLTRKVLQKAAAERNEALRDEFVQFIQDENSFLGDGREFV